MNCLFKTFLLGLFLTTGLSAEIFGDFVYSISMENEVTITSYTGSGGHVEIPGEIDGNPVVMVGGNSFAESAEVLSVTIPVGVTYIGSYCFTACSSLKQVDLPEGLLTIGNDAFRLCDALEEIVIPDSVTTLRSRAFIWCTNLTKVTLSDNLTELYGGTFYGCENLKQVTFGNQLQNLFSGAFEKCTSLTSVTIPASVLYFNQPVFRECTNLTSIEVSPDNETFASLDGVVLSKDMKTLIACPSGKSGTYSIPIGIEELDYGAFAYCDNITELVIPESLQSVDKSILRGCSNLVGFSLDGDHPLYACLDGVLFSKDLKEIEMYPSGREGDYVIPDEVQVIGEQAFALCGLLTGISIPNTVSSIENGAFAYCSSLTTVTLPASVISIGYGAFSHCFELQELNLGESLQSIGGSAFRLCWKLTSVSIPDTVTSLGERAFFDCDSLIEIHLGKGLTEIPEEAFSSCNALTRIFIPEGISKIGPMAFASCYELTDIHIPNSVTELSSFAFGACTKLTTVLIPANVTHTWNSFQDCRNLSAVYFLGDPPTSDSMLCCTSTDVVAYYLMGNEAWGNTYDGKPTMPFEPYIEMYPADGNYHLEFLGGILEKSTDIIQWTTVQPQPAQANLTTGEANGVQIDPGSGEKEFYRIRVQ